MIYYVDCSAKGSGDGSKAQPFLTIGEAAEIARPGDEVLVLPGIYRESVHPRHAGKESERITYRSAKPLCAVITGAEELCGWTKYDGNVWTTRVKNEIFGSYHPYTTYVCGDWYFAPTVRHTGCIFLNDLMMYETVTLEECLAGQADPASWVSEESKLKWYTKQDGDETVFYANFGGKDPNKENVEFSVRRNCFMPEENGINYITLSGFTICKAATTWAPPAAYQDGMVGPHWSKGWIIEDCEVYGSRCCGISLGKYRDPENDMYFYTRHVKSPTQMERDAVCRGQYHGWLKEKIGSHVIRRCHVHHCEQTGIVGRMGAVFSTIEDCHIHHICNTQQLGGAETAGIKLHAAIDVTIRRNHIHHSIIGVWLDWEAQGARITQNLMHDNHRPEGVKQAEGAMFSTDVFIEVGHGPTLIDNNLLLSRVSVSIPSEGIAVLHNLILGGFSLINGGVDSIVNGQREPRYTPYHIRHRTEVAGFMTILHGDDRICHNIFVQQYPIRDNKATPSDYEYDAVGTAPFDIFPDHASWIANFKLDEEPNMEQLATHHFSHLPVWIDGNAYFNGATVSKHETGKRNDTKHHVNISLSEENGSYALLTDLFSYLGEADLPVLNSDSLGTAFEPEQRFENPDGSTILFDLDYFGNKRKTATIPGPFASAGDHDRILF